MLQFQGRIRRYGNSYVVTVPADYVNNQLLSVDSRYWFSIEPAKDENPGNASDNTNA